MKKILLLLSLFLTLTVSGQIRSGTIAATGVTAAASSGNVYTDDMQSRTVDDTLGGQGFWRTSLYGIRVIDEAGDRRLKGWNPSGTQIAGTYYNQPISDDHASEVILDYVGTNAWCAVGVRISGTRLTNDYLGYFLEFAATGDVILYSVNNDTQTPIGTGTVNTALQVGDALRLEIKGNVLSCKQNGSLITSIDGDGMVTNNDIGTGFPGVATRNDNAGMYFDNWIGEDL